MDALFLISWLIHGGMFRWGRATRFSDPAQTVEAMRTQMGIARIVEAAAVVLPIVGLGGPAPRRPRTSWGRRRLS